MMGERERERKLYSQKETLEHEKDRMRSARVRKREQKSEREIS